MGGVEREGVMRVSERGGEGVGVGKEGREERIGGREWGKGR